MKWFDWVEARIAGQFGDEIEELSNWATAKVENELVQRETKHSPEAVTYGMDAGGRKEVPARGVPET